MIKTDPGNENKIADARMTIRFWLGRILRFAIVLLCLQGITCAENPPITNDGLSKEEVGHLVHFHNIAMQDLDDWKNWEGDDQHGMDAYRYQLAFMTYALALQQYHSVPAWREVHQPLIDRLIERMIQKPVWEFWAEVSKTSKKFDPDWEGFGPGTHDPVGEKNIMYSGHLVHMAALYEMLYRDLKWSKPGAYTFTWDVNEKFVYDQTYLLQLIQNEMLAAKKSGNEHSMGGMECEPNLIFPECNQHPTLAMILNDAVHGTMLSKNVMPAFDQFMADREMYHPKTKNVAAYYYVKQDKTFHIPFFASGSADGWTGTFMHAWQPKKIEAVYPKQRDKHMTPSKSGVGYQVCSDPASNLSIAFFAGFAKELGDTETAEKLLAYADQYLNPVWDKGALRFPVAEKTETTKKVSNTEDRLYAIARSNRSGGLWSMHNQPWQDKDFGYALVSGVDFPNAVVTLAKWDADQSRLNVTIRKGHNAPPRTTIQVTQLNPEKSYEVVIDGRVDGFIDWDRPQTTKTVRVIAPGAAELSLDLDSVSRIEITELPTREPTR